MLHYLSDVNIDPMLSVPPLIIFQMMPWCQYCSVMSACLLHLLCTCCLSLWMVLRCPATKCIFVVSCTSSWHVCCKLAFNYKISITILRILWHRLEMDLRNVLCVTKYIWPRNT